MAQSPAGKLIKATTDVLFSPFKLVASFIGVVGDGATKPAAPAPAARVPAAAAAAKKSPSPKLSPSPKKKSSPKKSPRKVIVKAEAMRVQPRRQSRRKSAGGGFYAEANQQQLGCAHALSKTHARAADLCLRSG